MEFKKLGEIADILISNVDKKTKENEYPVKLCNFVDVYYNWSISSYHYQNLMNATATKQEIDKFSIREGDVAITKDSETRDDIGVSTYISESLKNTLLGYHCVLIRPNKNVILGKYLNIVLHSSYAQKYFEANAGGSGQRYTLKDTIIKDMLIPIPSIEEQEQLGNLANSIDKKIENNNKINAKLESLAKTIYDYWFLQFEFPNEEGKPYKSSGGKMVWNEKLNRMIPDGWKNGNLYDIAEFTNGLACQKHRPIKNDQRLPVIKIREMHNGFTSETEWVRDDIPQKYVIDDGDILFSWSATLETIIWTGGQGALNQHIFKVSEENCAKYYVFMQLAEYVKNFVAMAEARKTTMGHITSDHLNQSRIALPCAKVIDSFEQKVTPLFTTIIKNKQESIELSKLRDFLLPLLMNGQVRF